MIRHFAQPDPCAASVTIGEIPEQTMATLVIRAARAGRSTQEYLRLVEVALQEPPEWPTDPAEDS